MSKLDYKPRPVSREDLTRIQGRVLAWDEQAHEWFEAVVQNNMWMGQNRNWPADSGVVTHWCPLPARPDLQDQRFCNG